MRVFLRILLYFFAFLLVVAISTLKIVDRTPLQEFPHYDQMMQRLDSLQQSFSLTEKELFGIGFSKVSLTPDSIMPLAGYGARKPKEFTEIFDSIFVRTIVLQTPTKKVALVAADLLIIHPELTRALHQQLPEIGWSKHEVFLSATHTHSSIGQWAPGLVGGLFAGAYEKDVASRIATKMIAGLQQAQRTMHASSVGYTEGQSPDLVLNRLVGDRGIEDPFQKNLVFSTPGGRVLFTAFSAHATCLTLSSRKLSGDFPSYYHSHLQEDTSILFSAYAAGPVASMGPETPPVDQFERTKFLGGEVAKRVAFPTEFKESIAISAFRIPLELGSPQFKIAKDLALRNYLFEAAFGSEPAAISSLLIDNTLLVGTPCDFSGELAVPLYEYARTKGLELMITSFNGGYIGYITKDEWYDLEKYETRTMNWYGPGNGAYFSHIIKRIIDAHTQNNRTNPVGEQEDLSR